MPASSECWLLHRVNSTITPQGRSGTQTLTSCEVVMEQACLVVRRPLRRACFLLTIFVRLQWHLPSAMQCCFRSALGSRRIYGRSTASEPRRNVQPLQRAAQSDIQPPCLPRAPPAAPPPPTCAAAVGPWSTAPPRVSEATGQPTGRRARWWLRRQLQRTRLHRPRPTRAQAGRE